MGEAPNIATAAAIRQDDFAGSGTVRGHVERPTARDPGSTCPVLEKTARRLLTKLASERTARRIVADLLERRTSEMRQLAQDLERRLTDQDRELRSARKQASRLADYDPLTGASSRQHFHASLRALGTKGNGTYTLLVLLDMDDFRSVNDCIGHRAGDEVLRQVATRLRRAVRKADYVARLGGDEFAVLCRDLDGTETAEELCKRLFTAMQVPFQIGDHAIPLTCSMGAVTVGSHVFDPEQIYRSADIALGVAKKLGRAHFVHYEAEMSQAFEGRIDLVAELRDAIVRKQLDVHFQPKVDARTRTVTGLEALARWQRADGTMVPPLVFIALAEDAGLIQDLGLHILELTCRYARPWIAAGLVDRIAVNLSPGQLNHSRAINEIFAVLAAEDFAPRHLELEITETYLTHCVDDAARQLQAIHERGATIALDDFGTGYSNLNFLKQLPLDVVKIDKGFVDGIADGGNDRVLVKAITDLARAFSLKTVAEGVETAEQARLLAEFGCDELQGYFMSRPLPADACQQWLEARATEARATDASAGNSKPVHFASP